MKKILPIITVLVAILGVISPILWDYYSNSSSLELRLLNEISLKNEDPIWGELSLTYKGVRLIN